MSTPTEDFNRAMDMLTGMTVETAESKRLAGAVTEMAANWLTPHYLLALRDRMTVESDGPARFKLMRKAVRDVVTFQRSGLSAARLQLDRERQKFKETVHQSIVDGTFAAGKKRDPNQPMTDEELKACVDKVDEIFGLKGVKLVKSGM
jgi:hypothetical protein